MSLSVVREQSRFDAGANKGVVVFEADSPVELDDLQCRKMAIEIAKQNGILKAGVSNAGNPYPTQTATATDGTPSLAAVPGTKFRRDVEVAGAP